MRLFRTWRLWWRNTLLIACLAAFPTFAQEQQAGLCAQIKMVISQQLTLERIGFQATLQITDNDPNNPITAFAANLNFSNPLLSSNGVVNDSSSLFFVQPPTFQNIQAVDGTGTIQPGQTATITWFLIPKPAAGGTSPQGIVYKVGAGLSGQLNGVNIPNSQLVVVPAPITVQPDAQLQITYFTPRDVTGMDPFTGLGAPIPFTFGVLVQNVGYGAANSMSINSQQPKIVSNTQNLPIVAQLLGSRVNDSALSNANLTVNLGTLQPGHATKGAWDMICTISGTFLSVGATYTHSTALGGQETSLIKSVNAYLFLHEVMDDQPGRDNVRDFLTDTSGNLDSIHNLIPDTLYESEGGVYPVNLMTNTLISGAGLSYQMTLGANFSGWGYIRLTDPNQARLPILSVVRSDGKVLNTNNYWTSLHYEPITNFKDTYLNLFDLVDLGTYTYSIIYTNPPAGTNLPVTTLMFAGSASYTNGAYYITPDTQMYFLCSDVNPVTIYSSLDGVNFGVALPFELTSPGTYHVYYYSRDTSGNQESTNVSTVILPGAGALGFASFTVPSQPIYNAGNAVSVRPGTVPISFQPSPYPTVMNGQIDIFQGVVAWVTVSNTPSSPTASTSAALAIGGQNVDYYVYQLNGGAWSAEQPVGTPLTLSGLSAGANTMAVLGRSQYGTYLAPSNAVTVAWTVDPSAPATTISGTPATPAHATGAQLTVGGTGISNYSWTYDHGYYRALSNVVNQIVLANLTNGAHVVAALGQIGGNLQSTNNPTTVNWMVNPLYGYDQGPLSMVRSVPLTNITGPVTYNWNGTSGGGVIQPPGWYTVRVTLADTLGNTNFIVGLAQIGAMSGTNAVLAIATRGPQNPYSRGRWAVWQDQSDGGWEIYAQDVTSVTNPVIQVTHNPLSQINPRTDGRYVAWQAQQPNGNWDVYLDDLAGTNGPQALTSSPTLDEIAPALDWPWVVCQVRATGNSSAPWQLWATNLANRQSLFVSTSTQDEVNPDVQAGRVVWQDFRDQGPGEIYFSDLQAAQARRITTNIFGQYHPAIYDNWIVWQDNRNIEQDIYGFDLLRNKEIRLTSTPADELQPMLNGPWVICMENSLGAGTGNGLLIHLPSLAAVPITHTSTLKASPSLAEGRAVWLETVANQSQVVAASLPSLLPVFQNRNVVAVTPAMVTYAQNAYGLLSLWASNGVQAVTAYTSLTPQVASQTATLVGGSPSGANFNLVAGSFLWIKFNSQQVLDLGVNSTGSINLAAGANVFSYAGFPDAYSAYQLLRQLGLNNSPAVRMLDAQSGRWVVAQVQNGGLIGNDFTIPNVAVLMVNVANPVNSFVPQAQ